MTCACLASAQIRASARRVALVDLDSTLVDAIARSLSAWEVQVVVVSEPPPPDSGVVAASAWAREIARSEQVRTVAWLAPQLGTANPSLWIYEADSEQLVVQPLSVAPPFDAAAAAAVALSVKTLLRMSALAPEAPTPPSSLTAPRSDSASPSNSAFASRAPSPPVAQSATRTVRLEGAAGARLVLGTPRSIEPRAGLGLSLWPRPWTGHIGLGAEASFGPGIVMEGRGFFGRATETAFRLACHARALGWTRFEVVVTAGGALHLAALDGETTMNGKRRNVLRLDPGIFAGVHADFLVTERISAGAYVETTYLLRTQQYAVGPQVLSDPSPFQAEMGVRLVLAVN